jgi:hypothetical protein
MHTTTLNFQNTPPPPGGYFCYMILTGNANIFFYCVTQLVVYFNKVLNKTIYNYLKCVYNKSWQHVSVVHSTIIRPERHQSRYQKCVLYGIPYSLLNFVNSKIYTFYTIQLMHYSHFKTQSLQHLKPIKC